MALFPLTAALVFSQCLNRHWLVLYSKTEFKGKLKRSWKITVFKKRMEIFFSHKVVDKETAAKKTEENRI